MPPLTSPLKRIRISRTRVRIKGGGAYGLERILGFVEDTDPIKQKTDVVFVSLDVECANRDGVIRAGEKPIINQLGFAKVDTRDMTSLQKHKKPHHAIHLSSAEVSDAPTPSSARFRGISPRTFRPPLQITQDGIRKMVTQNLQIPDTSSDSALEEKKLRDIVLVGHSIKGDVEILQHLGIFPLEITPVTLIIDTHRLSRFVLPPYNIEKEPMPGQDFSLGGTLGQLGWPVDPREFHNAGNDAVYTLYAMFLLATRGMLRGPASRKITQVGQERIDLMRDWLSRVKSQLDATSARVSTKDRTPW